MRTAGRLGELRFDTDLDVSHAVVRYLELIKLAALVERVSALAPVAEAEFVGLVPAAALEGLPPELPLRGFDPARHVVENALRSVRF